MQVVVFTLGENHYAFRTEQIDEISKTKPVSRMPNAQDWIEGLVNLRGEIVVLVNLEKILDKDVTGEYNNFIIDKTGDSKAGILVRDVKEVTEIDPAQIEKLSDRDSVGVSGIVQMGDRIVNYVDIGDLMEQRG